MSDRLVTGLRLLRALLKAEREFREAQQCGVPVAEYQRASAALDHAHAAMEAFEREAAERTTSADWKLRQAGE